LYTSQEIAAMNVIQLKGALDSLGQSKQGNKAQLAARLTAVAGPPPQQTTPVNNQAPVPNVPGAQNMVPQNNTQEFNDLMSVVTVCGLSRPIAEKFATMQTIVKMSDLVNFTPDGMEDAITMYNKTLNGTSEIHLRITNHLAVQRLRALVHRTQVWNLAGKELLPAEWSNASHAIQAVQELQAYEQREKSKSEPTEFPDELKADMLDSGDAERFFTVMRSTLTQCSSGHGHSSTLEYLLREATWPMPFNPTIAQEMTASLPHHGLVYESDNSRLFTLLEKLCINHMCWNTIKKYKTAQNGRGAYLALRRLYQGEDHVQSKISIEKQRISEGDEGLKYTGEVQLKFVNYASGLQAAYEFISQHRETYSEQTKVERLLQGFKGEARDNTTLHIARMHVKDNPSLRGDFDAAVAYLATKVQEVFPSVAGKATPPTRTVNETNQLYRGGRSSYRGGRGRYQNRGRDQRFFGGRGAGSHSEIRGDPNGKYNGQTAHATVNGVDTTDVNRQLSDKEFDDVDVRTYILNRRTFLRKNKSSYPNDRKIKEMAMEIAQTIMDKKRSGEDESNPRDDKKQKGEKEKDPWNLMGKGADR